jgi:hypothetical protein
LGSGLWLVFACQWLIALVVLPMVDRIRVDAMLTDHCRLGMWGSMESTEIWPPFGQTVTVPESPG